MYQDSYHVTSRNKVQKPFLSYHNEKYENVNKTLGPLDRNHSIYHDSYEQFLSTQAIKAQKHGEKLRNA